MAYFDNLGNMLLEMPCDYLQIDNRIKAYPLVFGIDLSSNNIAKIITNGKPIFDITIPKATSLTGVTKSLKGIKVAKFDNDKPLILNVDYVFKHSSNVTGSYMTYIASNNYNTQISTIENFNTYVNTNAIGDRWRCYGLIAINSENKPIGTQYIWIACAISQAGLEFNYKWISNNSWFGGTTAYWNDTNIYFIDIDIKDLDNSVNNSVGGGYGTGKNPTDNIDIPTLPTFQLSSAGSALYALNNNQMLAFTNWLWSSDWQDNIKKLQSSPMENIIGLSVCDLPVEGTAKVITLGNINTEVQGSAISNWVTLDCGSIDVSEYYASFADYEPYIATTLYLPKVGFVQIPADVLVNNTVRVVYHIELTSGEGLSFVYITNNRDGFSYVYNTYTCKCTSDIMLSASDHSQALLALASATINTANSALSFNSVGIGGTPAQTGGRVGSFSPTGLVGGLASGALSVATAKRPTQTNGHIGNMSALMCVKKPYLLINRTVISKPESYQSNNGYLIEYTSKIDGHTGFLKTRDFHCDFICPASFQVEIENLLNSGVYING